MGASLFPISSFVVPEHNKLKQDILRWMKDQELNPTHSRNQISHNVVEIGKTNELLKAVPHLKTTLIDLVDKHNKNTFNYSVRYDIVESYLELAQGTGNLRPTRTRKRRFFMHLFHQLQQRNPFKSKVQKAHILYILSIFATTIITTNFIQYA